MLPCAVLFVIGLSGSCWIRSCWPRFAVVGHWQSLRSSLPHSGLLTSRRGDLAGVSHYVGLGLERVSGWGERRERERRKRTATSIVVRLRHILPRLPTSWVSLVLTCLVNLVLALLVAVVVIFIFVSAVATHHCGV
jgi:hypothetical protein